MIGHSLNIFLYKNKKYSKTLSQYQTALFHVLTHSCFKALLFLGAGAVIHGMQNQQDVRRLGGLISFLPFIYTVMFIGSISLMAIPWLSGFYSKDLILELAFGTYSIKGYIAWVFGTLTACFTAFYSFRLISLTFLGIPAASVKSYNNVHEPSLSAIISLVFLAICSIFIGYLTSDAFVGLGSNFLGNSIFIAPNNIAIIEAEFALPLYIKLAPAVLTVVGGIAAVLLYLFFPNFLFTLTANKLGITLYTFFNGKYLLDLLLNNYIIRGGLSLGYTLSKYLDRGVLEYFGPFGLSKLNYTMSQKLNRLDDGLITNYVSYIIISILFINIFLWTYFIVDNSYFLNLNNEYIFNTKLLDSSELLTWLNSLITRNGEIKELSAISYLGPFNVYNPFYVTEISLYDLFNGVFSIENLSTNEILHNYNNNKESIFIHFINNKTHFLINLFTITGSTHFIIFFMSLIFIFIFKSLDAPAKKSSAVI